MAISTYRKRWEIETLFGCLKSRGFNFEDTHMVSLKKIDQLIAALAIAFCWAHKTGEWRCLAEVSIPNKCHGRKASSLFRYGLDYISEYLVKKGLRLKRKIWSFLFPILPRFSSENQLCRRVV